MMKLIVILFISLYFASCYPTNKNGSQYSKFCIEYVRPGIIEVGEDSVQYITHNFFSCDKYNVYEMEVYDVPVLVDDSSNIDTVFLNVDPFVHDSQKKITGYLVYNYENMKDPGLIIPKDSASYFVNVDSFFSRNAVKIDLNDPRINTVRLVSETITDSNVIIRRYAEANTTGGSDSLILFYSKEANAINYSITDKFPDKVAKLFKLISIEKPKYNVNGAIIPGYDRIIFGFRKLDITDKEIKFIKDCIGKYKKAIKG